MNKHSLRSIFILLAIALSCSGCASIGKTIKGWISGKDPDQGKPKITTPRFTDQENLRAGSDRQYRRMNRSRFEEEAELKADAGSLWVMEGQGAYLFAQNQMRMVGDLLNVKIEGGPKTQLQTKAKVIAKLLDRLENPNRGLASTGPGAGAQPAGAEGQAAAKPKADAEKEKADKANGEGGAEAAGAPGAKPEAPFGVQVVPTRIVEQLKDGSYRVKGMHPFMIGKREYKVIVTGIVRSEDFDDAGLSADKLLDPQFDIVSSRKGVSM